MPKYIVDDPNIKKLGRYLANDSTGGITYQNPDGTERDVCTWEMWVGGQIYQLLGFDRDPFPNFSPYDSDRAQRWMDSNEEK